MSHGCWFLDVLAVLIMLPVIFPIVCRLFVCLPVYLPNHPCSSICCWFLAASNCSDYITSWLSILWPDFHSVSLSVYLVAHICSLVCQICLLSYQITRCFLYARSLQGRCHMFSCFLDASKCLLYVYSCWSFQPPACHFVSLSAYFMVILVPEYCFKGATAAISL